MIFSKNSGTLVCDDSFLPAVVAATLASHVPGDDPFLSLRSLLFVRGDASTSASKVSELAEWMDLYGRVRQAGLSLSEVEALLVGSTGVLPTSGLLSTRAVAPNNANTSASSSAGKKAMPPSGFSLGQEFFNVSRKLSGRLASFSEDGLSAVLRWETGKTQTVTVKTLRDRRRYDRR